MTAVERELLSLRLDLRMTAAQSALFDGFERQVRNAAATDRMRSGHLSAFRLDDGSSPSASAVFGTLADDDVQRADAARLALERMTDFYAALTTEQQRQFDQRIIQSVRVPLGAS